MFYYFWKRSWIVPYYLRQETWIQLISLYNNNEFIHFLTIAAGVFTHFG